MDTTISTITSGIPESLRLAGIVDNIYSFSPTDLNLEAMAKFLLFFCAGSLILSIISRAVLGKRSSLNHSLSSVMAILFVYALTAVVYSLNAQDSNTSQSPLPFVTFFNDYMVILPIVGIRLTVLCRELLSLVILSFLVNLLDTFIPKGKSMLGWFVLRLLTVILALTLHILIHWACDTYLPNAMMTYAPAILLSLLIIMLTLGFLNAILGLVLTITNPLIGALYSFFFSNVVGKQFTKAVFTTAILCAILYFVGEFGYSFINISTTSLVAYIPMALSCLGLWLLIGRLL